MYLYAIPTCMLNKQINPYSLCISCRYGKFFVLDLLDVDGLWAGVEEKMNMVQKDLLTSLMDKSLFKENKSVGTGHVHSTLLILYLCCRIQSLTRASDGEEYSAKQLLCARVHDFKLVVLTQLFTLSREFTEKFYVIRIHTSNPN